MSPLPSFAALQSGQLETLRMSGIKLGLAGIHTANVIHARRYTWMQRCSMVASESACRLAMGRLGGGTTFGATGAAYACFAFCALWAPHEWVQYMSLRMRAGSALVAAIGFEALGVLLGWRMLDHWGHLGGAAFGICFHFLYELYIYSRLGRKLVQAHGITA